MTLRSDTLPSTKRADFMDDTVFGTTPVHEKGGFYG